MFYTCNYNIRVTHRNGAIKHIFYTESNPRRDHKPNCSLFILSLHALALHLAVKILLQIFLYEDLSTLTLHTSVGCISLQNASRTALCYAMTILLMKTFLIFDINHRQNTRRSDQIETIKTMCKLRACYHMSFYRGSGCHFKEIFDQVRKDLDCELFYSELKRHNVSHYIYYLATNNIHRVENDNTVLIKGLKKVVNVKFSKHASYRNVL